MMDIKNPWTKPWNAEQIVWRLAHTDTEERTPEDVANARLIEAAPRLYAACRFAIAKLDDGGAHLYAPEEVEQVINAIHDAMAHAKGREA